MILQLVFSIFLCSPLPSGTCRTLGLSIPWCCLTTSSSVCLVFFPLSPFLARWFWPDLMNGKHDRRRSFTEKKKSWHSLRRLLRVCLPSPILYSTSEKINANCSYYQCLYGGLISNKHQRWTLCIIMCTVRMFHLPPMSCLFFSPFSAVGLALIFRWNNKICNPYTIVKHWTMFHHEKSDLHLVSGNVFEYVLDELVGCMIFTSRQPGRIASGRSAERTGSDWGVESRGTPKWCHTIRPSVAYRDSLLTVLKATNYLM